MVSIPIKRNNTYELPAVYPVLSVLLQDRQLNNIENCKQIRRLSNEHENIVDSFYVPSLLLSNVMSIVPKIDEIFYFLNLQNIDIDLFTETWLKNTIPNEVINIAGYHLYRHDRINRMHGGVCMFIKDSIILAKN